MSEFTPSTQDSGSSGAPQGLGLGGTRFNVPFYLTFLYGILNPVRYPGVRNLQEQGNPNLSFPGVPTVTEEEHATSYIGTPIFFPVTLKGGTYKRADRDGKIEQVRLNDLRLPLTTVVEMSREKLITKTPIVAAQSSVKEIYTHDDWSIRITGILMDEPKHPQGAEAWTDQQDRLLEFDSLSDSIEVDGDLFHGRGIYRLVIRNISFTQVPGRPRAHAFQMQCDSDDPLELIL